MSAIAYSITQSGCNEPFELQVSRGQVLGHSASNLFGFTTVLGSTAYGPMWEGLTSSGGDYAYPASPVIMSIVSSSASDTAVSVTISGLGADYVLQSETVALNGTTPVLTTKTFLRINRVFTVAGNAVGTITVTNGATTYAKINIGNGDTQMSIYSVPAGYTFYQTYLQADANTSLTSGAYIRFRTRIVDNTTGGVITAASQAVFSQQLLLPLQFPLQYEEKHDIQWQLQGSGGAGSAANIFIGGILIKNDVAW